MGRSSDITQDQIRVTLCGWISGDSFSRTLNGTPPSATLVSTRSPAFGTQLYVIVRRLRPILLSLLFASVCLPQSAEERPALCGMGLSNLSLPSNVTVESDSLLIRSRLTLRTANSSSTIDLPAVSQIQQVCDVAPNKLVVFGLEAPAVYSINIIDKNTWRVLDSFEGFSPALSPDKHYVVFRKFYPRQTSLPVSEEYLLYDLDKDWKQNRGVGLSEKETVSVGVVIYPLGRPNTNADDLGLPADQLHVFRRPRSIGPLTAIAWCSPTAFRISSRSFSCEPNHKTCQQPFTWYQLRNTVTRQRPWVVSHRPCSTPRSIPP